MSVPEAARFIGISVAKCYQDVRPGGTLEPLTIRIGARILFSRARLERWLNGETAPVA